MPILNAQIGQAGLAGVLPSIIYLDTNDTLAEVLTAGFLNGLVSQGLGLREDMMALVSTKTSSNSPITQVAWLEVSRSGNIWSLVPTGAPGSVTLPTITNHIAVYTNTTGNLGEDAATAINAGNIQAGLSGTAGEFTSFPAAALNGSLSLKAAGNAGNFAALISNISTLGQATTYTMPDAANAVAHYLVGATATPFLNGNFPVASGTAGLMVDSGVAAASLQSKANIKAATTGNIGGAGAGPITVPVTGMTAASVVVATISSSSSPVSVVSAIAGTAGFDVTFSGDPGASCILNYTAFIVAQ